MGRAYEVRKASIQKNGMAKAKTYSTFAKEIYLAAKKGVPEIDANVSLKRIVEKAKGVGGEDYTEIIYEGFGPGASTLIIKTLTDNVNRTVGEVRAAFNKVHKSLGVTNSVSYNYDYLGIISFKSLKEEEIFEAIIANGIEPVDFECNDKEITISVNPTDHDKTKDVIESIISDVEYDFDEIGMFPKEEIELNNEDLEVFTKLYNMLESIEDVTMIYHNVKNFN